MPADNITNESTNGLYRVEHASIIPSRVYSINELPSLSEFQSLCSKTLNPDIYPLAHDVKSNIPIYDLSLFGLTEIDTTSRLQDEWHHILLSGPGVFVLRNLMPHSIITSTNAAFGPIIKSEASSGAHKKGDHFSGGTNTRIWNSFSKHCLSDASSFLQYYSSPWLSLICAAWLGPGYRITAQANIVRPGGSAQISHRDYHLGFQTADMCAQFPAATHHATQLLTLQGAVAHSDMPLESGPTRFLPFSQLFPQGYLAYRRKDFDDFFREHYVALALSAGDAVFFNPGLHHAAGANVTANLVRSANLLQVSSAFGKPMEQIDTLQLIESTWDGLRSEYDRNGMSAEVKAFVAAVAEGYQFPTNLDRWAPRVDGMAPESEQELLIRGLESGWTNEEVMKELRILRADSRP